MNGRLRSHVFWGKHAPLSALTGAGLLIMASSRLAYAVFSAGGLLWVFGLTALGFFSAQKILPVKGKPIILLFIASLASSMYLVLMSILNPLLVAETWFFLAFIPPYCIGSGLFELPDIQDLGELLPRAWLEAACLGLIIIAVSLIREPLGSGSLSFPGGTWGFMELVVSGEEGEGFFPISLLSVSAGGFIVLGFCIAVFRYFLSQKPMEEDNQ